jgi:hypothetical protein
MMAFDTSHFANFYISTQPPVGYINQAKAFAASELALVPPIFVSTEWLDDCRWTQGSAVEGEVQLLKGNGEGANT